MSDTEKIASILRAAGELLDDSGYEAVGTTEIARQAGVSTATLYRHFEDKHQILERLLKDLHEGHSAAARAVFRQLEQQADWRAAIESMIRQTYDLRLAQPGGRIARRTLHASPLLRKWDREQELSLARRLGQALRKRAPALSADCAQHIALTTLAAVMALLDMACADSRRARKLVDEAVTLAQRYLAPHLDTRLPQSA
ncbi:MAG: TetR/AcrR family transcriptional regulator [Burkholderiales bacterium]|jgi:AcrR family transcriptional regulator